MRTFKLFLSLQIFCSSLDWYKQEWFMDAQILTFWQMPVIIQLITDKYIIVSKFGKSMIFSSAFQGCIYLIRNMIKTVNMWNIIVIWNSCFLCEFIIDFCDAQMYYQHHYCSLQCHMIFRNHNNILLKKHFRLLSMLNTVVLHDIFAETMMYVVFQDSQMNRKLTRAAFIWNRNIL